jgi:hypothetical protein
MFLPVMTTLLLVLAGRLSFFLAKQCKPALEVHFVTSLMLWSSCRSIFNILSTAPIACYPPEIQAVNANCPIYIHHLHL